MTYVPTLQFRQTQNQLQQKKASGEIDEGEYCRQIDELIVREVREHLDTVINLAVQELREETSRELQAYEDELQKEKKKLEQKQLADDLAKERYRLEEQRQQEEREKRQRQARDYYRFNIVPNEIATLKQEYARTKNYFNWLQIISIIFSIATTTLVGTDLLPRFFALICSGVAAIAAALLSTFHMRERNYSYYQAISSIESEIHDYDQRVGGYAGLGDEEAYVHFAARISEIKQQYMSQELAMWKVAASAEGKPAEEPSPPRGRTQATKGRADEDEKQAKSEKAEAREGESEKAT
ncbi:MAG: DUF4231 domain-containing protein [Ktedonobacteraceae bacterium]|nr:DUF4231 domain-containing protein [Ktedonobacteraceae bacterium]